MSQRITKMRLLFVILVMVATSYSLLAPLSVQADLGDPVGEYEPLAPLSNSNAPVTVANYIPELFRLGIGIAAGLAVLAIAYGGILWMTSDVVTNKSKAIETIKNALLGLLLALASWLILYTINPELTGQDALRGLAEIPPNSPIQRSPAGAGQSGNFKLTFYDPQFILDYQKNDFELTYRSNNGGNPTIRERYASMEACIAASRAAPATPPATRDDCSRRPAYWHYTYGTPILRNDTYEVAPDVTRTFAVLSLCNDQLHPIENDEAYTIINPCGRKAPAGSTTRYFETLAECQEEARTREQGGLDQGSVILDRCTDISQDSDLEE